MRRRTFMQLAIPALLGARYAHAQSAAGMRLLLLGTQGGPNFRPARAEAGNAVLAGGQLYLVDCGYGSLASLVGAGHLIREVDQVFFTHLHDDHTADFPALIGHQWTDGRVTPVGVYGPAGTQRLLTAAIDVNAINEEIRFVDESRSVRIRDVFSAHEIEATPKAAEVFSDNSLRVIAVESNHYPAESKARMPHRALSYRFESLDRSIVFSGDTALSSTLVELARGADVFVCEAMDIDLQRKSFEERVAQGAYADNPEGIWHHIVTTHTTTEQAGEMAAAAGVGMLVLSHVIPGAQLPDVPDETYAAAARKHFKGRIVVGADRLVL